MFNSPKKEKTAKHLELAEHHRHKSKHLKTEQNSQASDQPTNT